MMIRSKRFSEFVDESVKLRNEEEKEKSVWELWLHKIHDKSWGDTWSLVDSGSSELTQQQNNVEDLKATIMESREILESFCPA